MTGRHYLPVAVLACGMALSPVFAGESGSAALPAAPGGSSAGPEGPAPVAPARLVRVALDAKHDVSLPLWMIPPIPADPWTTIREMHEEKEAGDWLVPPAPGGDDPVVQRFFTPAGDAVTAIPGTVANFEGVPNLWGVVPADTNGDVGPHHYVQWVNLSFEVFSKQGASLYGPAAGASLWSGFGAPCENHNNGDPIALYDPMADRWVMGQFTSSGT